MGKASAPAAAGRLVSRLRAAGCVYAEEEAALLLAGAPDDAGLERMLAERTAGRPLEYVLGWAEFCGLHLLVSDGVFIPRRRTEFLAGLAAAEPGLHAVAVDLCCGAGALSAVIARRTGTVEIFAVDCDAAAVACARRNLGARVAVLHGDLFDPLPKRLRGRVDVLAANAPYVPTGQLDSLPSEARLYEPEATHDGGADGLAVLARIAAQAPAWLRSGGVLLAECAETQAAALAEIFAAAGLSASVLRDPETEATVVRGVERG